MAGRAAFSQVTPRFGEVSLDILTDILSNLNKRNKIHLESVSDLCGCLKDSRLVGEWLLWPLTSALAAIIGRFCDWVITRWP